MRRGVATVAGVAAGAAGRRVRDAVTAPSPRLRRRFVVDDDWRRLEDGGAVRLDSATTIAVSRRGRWGQVDPLVSDDGWRRPWAALGLALWAGAVGVAWWAGSSRGRGPLAGLHDPPGRPGS